MKNTMNERYVYTLYMHFDSELLTLKTFYHEFMTINNFCYAQNYQNWKDINKGY